MKEESLLQNSIFNVFYRCLNIIFPVVSSAYVARILLPEGVGRVAYSQNLAQYFAIFAVLGIPTYGIRLVSVVKGKASDRRRIVEELGSLGLISGIVCFFAYIAIVFVSPLYRTNGALYVVAGVGIIFSGLNVDWFFQGIGNYRFIAIRGAIIRVLSLVLIFCFVRNSSDLIVYCGILVFGTAGNNIWNFCKLVKTKNFTKFRFSGLQNHIRSSLVFFATSLVIQVYVLFDVTLLGLLSTVEAVAYYSNSVKLVRMLLTTIAASTAVFLPRLTLAWSEDREQFRKLTSTALSFLSFVLIPSCIGLFLISDELAIFLYGTAFIPVGETLKISSFLIPSLGFSGFVGTQILVSSGNENKLLIAVGLGACVSLIMNIIFIPRYQQNGAAWAGVISETIVLALCIWFSHKVDRFQVDFVNFGKVILASCALGLLITVAEHYLNGEIFMLTSLFFGGLVYFALSIAMKNSIAILILKFLRSFIKK
ncbi:MAG: flippase [Propionibacteriaceae bacterium]|jgi:O-antigen/teichoic acid export membrane protein|nr:flippase [Propionibacteriaceae bacterium]